MGLGFGVGFGGSVGAGVAVGLVLGCGVALGLGITDGSGVPDAMGVGVGFAPLPLSLFESSPPPQDASRTEARARALKDAGSRIY